MAIGEIDLTLPAQNVELFLAKPNREVIAKLSEAFNKKMILKLGNINEVTFTLPYEIDKNRRMIRNPNVDLIRERYLIKAIFAGKTEWYKVISITNSMSDSDLMDVTCYLLPYELSDKNIKIFSETAINLDQAMNGGRIIDPDSGTSYEIDGLLDETMWTVGYVDADIASKYRGYEFTSTTVLDSVFKVAETLNALIIWNTATRTISFYNADNYGINRGLTINYGRYLKSMSRESNSDELVTRLKVFGKDGMSIQTLNINGQNYLEDYSYFLYPFQRDAKRNVIQKSHYMSDALCHAILNYTEYKATKEGQFKTLLTQKTTYETSLGTKNNELSALTEKMKVIDNNIDIHKSMGYDFSTYIAQKSAIQIQINNKNSEISSVKSSITSIEAQIITLKNSLKYSAFFTPTLLGELNEFIIYREFSDDSYSDVQTLYDDAVKEFEKAKQPQVVLNMDIVNFMSLVEAQRDWDKLNLGDTITIRYNKLNIDMQAKIIEITIDFESDNINFTIANTKDILTDDEKLIKMLYSNNSSSTLLSMKSSKWDGIDATTSKVNEIIDNTWSAIKNGIEGGVNNTISFSERGILVKNTEDANNYLIIQNGVLAITNDNGNSWKHAITANGIVGERIYGKLLAGSNLVIDASDAYGVKTFTVDSSGVKILGSKLFISGGITEDNLSDVFLDRLDKDILEVQDAVNDLEINVNEILSDGMITSIEANTLKVSLAQVASESSDIVSVANALGITTEKTNYSASLTNLTNEINKWIDKTYPMAISAASRTDIANKFSDIQAKKSILINKISAIRQALSESHTNKEIEEVNNAITTLDTDLDRFSSDLSITLAEANSLKISLSQVNSESTDLINVASTLNITTEKTNYYNALAALTTEISKWIDKSDYPMVITNIDRANIKKNFEVLQSTKSILINKIAAIRQNLSQAYADSKITAVNESITELDTNINLFSSDSIITLAEANALKINLSQVNSESTDLINVASGLSITTERTNYANALKTLTSELNKWIDKSDYPLTITANDRSNIRVKFEALQNTKSILINKISAIRQSLSQTYTDGKIATVNQSIDQLDTDITQFSSDSVITLAEANSLKLSLSQVNSESVDLISVAGTLGITTEKTNYSNALAKLTTEINKWIGKTYPLDITSESRTSVKNVFDALQSTKSILINKIAAVREQRAKDASVGLGKAYNGVVIDAENGLVITKSDGTIRTILNATDGFSFEKKSGSTWQKKLYYNATTGNLALDGELNARSIKINGVELIAGAKLDGDMIDSIKVQQLDATTARITTAMIETLEVGKNVVMGANAVISWSQVSNQPSIPSVPNYIQSTRITSTTIESPNIYGGTIAIGSGNSIFKADANGVYLGNSTFNSAPFRVSMNGYLNASGANISGSITSSTISSSTIKTADSGTRVQMNSFFADINLYHGNTHIFQILDDITNVRISNPSGYGMTITGPVYASGAWNFSDAQVSGVTAVFG